VTDLVDTTEMYLRTILDLEEERIVPLRARISERLGHSGPTVSQTISRMERDGLVTVEGDRHLELTAEGRRRAVHVMRKHRLAGRLPAPGLGRAGERRPGGAEFMDGVIALPAALDAAGDELRATIRRLSERVQVDPELLEQLKEAGIQPGASATISRAGDDIRLEADGGTPIVLPIVTASHLFVVV